jgi:hypothetical protein
MLIDLFVRIENFFRRLEAYTELQPTPPMMDIIVKIMVEVLTILAIATTDIKQKRASELTPSDICRLSTFPSLEKIMKRLLGKHEIDDALMRLDTLTQDEARMATLEVLKVARNIENQVQVVIEGSQTWFSSHPRRPEHFIWLGGKEAKVVMQQTANEAKVIVQQNANEAKVIMQQTIKNVDEVDRSSPPSFAALLPSKLSRSHREAVASGPSEVALPTGSLDKPQRRPPGPARGDSDVVFRGRYLQEMEINPFSLVGTWKAYVLLTPFAALCTS